MEPKESRSAGFTLQGMLLLVFLVALSIFSVWFFAQRGWWLPEVASVHGASLDAEFMVTLAITGFMFIVLKTDLGVLALKFASYGVPGKRGVARGWRHDYSGMLSARCVCEGGFHRNPETPLNIK